MEKTQFEVEGIPVYRYVGAQPRHVLLMLPGIGGYGGYYDAFCAYHVETGVEVWGMDPPGHGRSAKRRGRFTMEEYLADIVTLAEHIHARTGLPVFTLGSSLGSGAAFHALELSDRLVGGIGMGICIGAAGWMPQLRRLFNAPDVNELMAFFGDALEMNIFRMLRLEDNYGSPELVRKIMSEPLISERFDLSSYKSYIAYEPPTPTKENVKPFYIVVGGADPMFPREEIDAVCANLGGPVTLTVVPDAPHQVMFFRTAEFSKSINDWVARQLPPAA